MEKFLSISVSFTKSNLLFSFKKQNQVNKSSKGLITFLFALALMLCIGLNTYATSTTTLSGGGTTATPASNVCHGSTGVQICYFELSQNATAGTLVGLQFTPTGTFAAADISKFYLYRYTSSTWPGTGTATLVATINPLTGGNGTQETFGTISISLAANSTTNYFWIVMDVASSVTDGHTITIPGLAISNSAGTNTVRTGNSGHTGTSSAAGTQTLIGSLSASVASSVCMGSTVTATISPSHSGTWSVDTGGTYASINSSTGVVTPLSAGGPATFTFTASGGTCTCCTVTTVSLTVNASPTATASNSGSVCSGNSITLTGGGGGTYAWSGPNSFTSTQQSPTVSNPPVGSDTYTLTVTSSGCTNTASTTVVIWGAGGWTGATSTDWNTGSNWCSGSVPGPSTDVTIPSGPANQPTISAAGGTCANITINSGASLTMGGAYTLAVSGNWTNNGTYTDAAGTVNFNGSTAQTIDATTFYTLDINNAAGVSLLVATTVTNLTIGDVTANSVFNDGGFQLTASGTLTLSNSSTFKLGSGANATTYPGFATNTISAGTTVSYASTAAQTIAAANYGNLTASGGNRTLASSGTIGISGTFTTGSGTYTTTSSAVTFTGTSQTIPALSFNNLTISGSTTPILASSGTIGIAGSFTNGSVQPTVTGSTVNYSGAGQTLASMNYNNLTLSGSGTDVFQSGTTAISGNLSISGAVASLVAGTTITANALTLGGAGAINGLWGGTAASGATYQSSTYFGSTSSGIVNVNSNTCSGTWVGLTSTDWNTAGNWTTTNNCGVPTSATDVFIPSTGPTYYPTIGAAGGNCHNIIIQLNTSLTILGSNQLTVYGNWTNNGTFTCNQSVVDFKGTNGQEINGSSTSAFYTLKSNNASAPANLFSGYNNNNPPYGAVGVFNQSNSLTLTNLTIGDVTANSLFNDGGASITANGTLTLSNSSTYALSYASTAASSYPNFGTNTIASGTTVAYCEYGQTIAALNYGNLLITDGYTSGGNTYYPTVLSSGTIGISGTFQTGTFQSPFAPGVFVPGLYAFPPYQYSTFTTTGNTVNFNGSSPQTIPGFHFNNLTISNSAGVTLATTATTDNVTVSGTLTLNNPLTLGAYNLILGSSAVISGASSSNYIKTNGAGKLWWSIPTSSFAASNVYPIADGGGNYAPVSLSFTSNSVAGAVGVNTTNSTETNMNTPSAPQEYLTRYWTFQNSLYGSTYNYTGNFQYQSPGNVSGTESAIKLSSWRGSAWTEYDSQTSAASGTLTINSSLTNSTANLSGDFTGRTAYPCTNLAPTMTANANSVATSTTVCSGNSISLTAASETNGTNCTGTTEFAWFNGSSYWNGSAFSSSTPVYNSSYSSISTSATATTTFTLTGLCSLNPSCAISTSKVTVTVYPVSGNPTSAAAGTGTICNGGSTTLTLSGGGGGGADELIKWYTNSGCTGSAAATGNGAIVNPTSTQQYWGRYEDSCGNNSTTATVTVTVTP